MSEDIRPEHIRLLERRIQDCLSMQIVYDPETFKGFLEMIINDLICYSADIEAKGDFRI